MDFKLLDTDGLPNNDDLKELDYKDLLNKSIIDRSEVISRPPVAISLGNYEYKGNYYPTTFGSYGDFSCIVGASKSKKTFLKSLIVGGYIGFDSNKNTLSGFKGHDLNNKFVYDIDTEQSRFHAKRVFDRVDDITGVKYDNYIGMTLREKSPIERFEIIDYLFTKSENRKNLGLVIIDGLADLVNDFNNLEECTKLTNKLLEWSAISKCHIITVLHKNFGTSKPVGHLGSTVLKKAETVVFTNLVDEGVEVTPNYTRNMPFIPFVFDVNENFIPYVINGIDESKDVPF